MTETQKLEREYVIPLRREWRKTANYRRAGIAIREIKRFVARHMRVQDRDVDKVKLDVYLNNEVWFRGRQKPPAKIRVKARKEGEIVKVELAEIPKHVEFLKKKQEKVKKIGEAKKPEEAPAKTEEKKEEIKPEEQEEKKKEEVEKEKAVAEQRATEAKQEAKMQKHLKKTKETQIRRMALRK